MKVIGLVGWSGSGKTTLLERVLPVLVARGLRVSTMKHAHHEFDVDRPGKDSWRHRHAGASEVMVVSARRWALMHENRDAPEPDVETLIARMTPVDLLLIEGFKRHPHDKIEVYRPDDGNGRSERGERSSGRGEPLWRSDPSIVAVALNADCPAADRAGLTLPVLDLDDPADVAAFILRHCGLG